MLQCLIDKRVCYRKFLSCFEYTYTDYFQNCSPHYCILQTDADRQRKSQITCAHLFSSTFAPSESLLPRHQNLYDAFAIMQTFEGPAHNLREHSGTVRALDRAAKR